jgi:hypothetical protein
MKTRLMVLLMIMGMALTVVAWAIANAEKGCIEVIKGDVVTLSDEPARMARGDWVLISERVGEAGDGTVSLVCRYELR